MAKFSTKKLAKAGIISALYVVLSLITFPVASGSIQFRLSEGLTLLPLFMIESVPALFIGCLLSNIITACMPLDVIFGSLVTLFAGILTYLIGKIIKNKPLKYTIGGIFPVLLNAFLLPVIWYFCYGELEYLYILQVAFLLISQAVSVYAFGVPMSLLLEKKKL